MDFFQAVTVLVWMHHMDANKDIEKNLDENYARILRALLANSGSNTLGNNNCTATYLPSQNPSKTCGRFWRSKDELM